MQIERNVDVVSALEFTGNVRAEILDRVAEQGPEEFTYHIEITNFTPGRPGKLYGDDPYPPDPAEYEHDGHVSNAPGDLLAKLILQHGDLIHLRDVRDIVDSIRAHEDRWIAENLDAEVFEAKAAEKDYWEEERWEREERARY